MWWQIHPRLLIDLITGSDEAKAAKAMMTLIKIDSKQLQRAVET